MRRANALVELIESMSLSERIYFQKWVTCHANTNHTRVLSLFDEVCGSKSQNQNSATNLKLAKDLYDLILECLRIYHTDKSLRIRVEGLLIESLLLFDRGLDQQALKRVKKAEKIASDCGELLDVIKTRRLTSKLLKLRYTYASFKKLEQIQKDNQIALNALQLEDQMVFYLDQITFYRNNIKKRFGSVEYPKILKEAFDFFETIGVPKEELTFNSRLARETIYSQYFGTLEKDLKEEAKHQLNIIELFETEFPHLIDEYFRSYMGAVNNYISHCFDHQNNDEAKNRIDKFSKVSSTDKKIQLQIDFRSMLFNQQLYLNTYNFSAAIEQRKDFDVFFKSNLQSVSTLIHLIVKQNILVAYMLQATLLTTDLNIKQELLKEGDNFAGFFSRTPEFNQYQKEMTKVLVLRSIIALEMQDLSSAGFFLLKAAGQCERNSVERKIIMIMKRCCNRPIFSRWDPLKIIYERKYNVAEWMEELDLWIKSKVPLKDIEAASDLEEE